MPGCEQQSAALPVLTTQMVAPLRFSRTAILAPA